MNTSYTQLLEQCIKNELMPIYFLYFKSQGVEPPAISIEHLLRPPKRLPALLTGGFDVSRDG